MGAKNWTGLSCNITKCLEWKFSPFYSLSCQLARNNDGALTFYIMLDL